MTDPDGVAVVLDPESGTTLEVGAWALVFAAARGAADRTCNARWRRLCRRHLDEHLEPLVASTL